MGLAKQLREEGRIRFTHASDDVEIIPTHENHEDAINITGTTEPKGENLQ